jgi:rod shape-determining protein MreD
MDWTKQLIRYIVIMLLQILLFNQLQLWNLCHPYIYVLCLLMMPITLPHNMDMLIGAAVGLVMDTCCNSLGVHTAACILIMFIRPYLIGSLINDKDRLNDQVCLHSIGMEAFIKYVLVLVPIHHFTVFMIGAWSWHYIGFVLLETLISGFITLTIIISYNLVKYR